MLLHLLVVAPGLWWLWTENISWASGDTVHKTPLLEDALLSNEVCLPSLSHLLLDFDCMYVDVVARNEEVVAAILAFGYWFVVEFAVAVPFVAVADAGTGAVDPVAAVVPAAV